MGFNVDAGRCIEEADEDLRNMGIYLASKPVQNLVTDSNIAFLGVLINTEACTVKKIVDETLKALETELMLADPDNFPKSRHGRAK